MNKNNKTKTNDELISEVYQAYEELRGKDPYIVFKDFTVWIFDKKIGKFIQTKGSELYKEQGITYKAFDKDAYDQDVKEYIKHQEEKYIEKQRLQKEMYEAMQRNSNKWKTR